jgi:sugar lactone lactonase YvrE
LSPHRVVRLWLLASLTAQPVLAASPPIVEPARRFVPAAVVHAQAHYPEGPQWLSDGRLLVAEMPRHRVIQLQGGKVATVFSQDGCGPTSVKALPRSQGLAGGGGYWILCHLGHRVLRVDDQFRVLATVTEAGVGRRLSWPNDGSVDEQGNLYLSSAGLFSLSAPAEGAVVRIEAASNRAQVLASGLRYSNGVRYQASRHRVLVSEHLNHRVLAFDLQADGKLGPSRVLFDFAHAPKVADAYELSGPDGIAVFRDGTLLVADYGNGRLLHLSDGGKLLAVVRVQLRFVTNMAIADDERSMFVVMTENNQSLELHGIVQRFDIQR